MLLPSDVARLVLGYLEQEGLCSTIQAFVLESPNLKEYASRNENHGEMCKYVFSLFGKNLTTILAEYVIAKVTEMRQENEVPALMTSLWKKLDMTLNQIKRLQSSLTLPADQSCSEKAASEREVESKTSKMPNTAQPKGSKRRKMAHPLPRVSRPVEMLLPTSPFRCSPPDTQSGPHAKGQSSLARIPPSDKKSMRPPQRVGYAHSFPAGSSALCSLPLEAETHPDTNESRDSAEIPKNPAPPPSQLEGGLRISDGLKGQVHLLAECSTSSSVTGPDGPTAVVGALEASGKSGVSRVDVGQSTSHFRAAIFPSRNALETAGTRSWSGRSSMLPSSMFRQPEGVGLLSPVRNTFPGGREVTPTSEGILAVTPKALSPETMEPTVSPTSSSMTSRPNPPGETEPSNIITGSDEDDETSTPFQSARGMPISTEALSTAVDQRSTRHSQQEAIGATVPDSTLQASLVQPTLQSGRVPNLATEQKDMQKFTVDPSQVKPNARTELLQEQATDTGTAVMSVINTVTEGEPVATPPSRPSRQNYRRMLCFEVSGANASGAKTSKLDLNGQCTSGPTFRWMKPTFLDGARAVASKTPVETQKASEVGNEASKIRVEESLTGDRKGDHCRTAEAWRPRLQSVVGGKDVPGLDSFGRKSHIAHCEEETELRRGTNQVMATVKEERDLDRRSEKMVSSRGEGEWTRTLEMPPHMEIKKEIKLEGREWGKPHSGTATPSGARVHSPEPPSSVFPRQAVPKASVLVRKAAEMLRDIREQSPAPSPSKPLPLPRTGAQGCDRADRVAILKPFLQDSTPPDGPTSVCSPDTNMAARTLMILSGAIMAQTGTQPRHSGQQGATHTCQGRKRLQHELLSSPGSVKELHLSVNRTRVKRRKRLADCFPDDLDVDKFLSSLHYDE